MASATVNLLDDEMPVVTAGLSDGVAAEPGTDTGKFLFYRKGSTAAALTVIDLGGDAKWLTAMAVRPQK